MEKQYLKIDFEKVGETYLKVLAWYKLLKLFDKEEWVSGGKIMKVTNRSVSSATKPLLRKEKSIQRMLVWLLNTASPTPQNNSKNTNDVKQ
jgi:hypothetical protein